jgi:ribonuclease HI
MSAGEDKAGAMPARLVLYFDGLCEPKNPGGWCTYGWQIQDTVGAKIASGHGLAAKKGEPHATNNYAEYCALGFGLRWLAERGWGGEYLSLRGDSKLVINQVMGGWACNKKHLQKLRQRCLELLEQLADDWEAVWIPREENSAADALSRRAYEEATGQPVPERCKP